MDTFNLALTRLFDVLLWPFRSLHPMWGLAAVSVLTGVVMLWLFGKVSNQRGIRRFKTHIKGHLLEMWIFRDNLRVVLKAQGRTLWNTAKYAACSMQALVVIFIPVVLIMIQLQVRYGYEPLGIGSSTIVKVHYRQVIPADGMNARLETPVGVDVETAPLRIPDEKEVAFRVRAAKTGEYEIRVTSDEESISKTICVVVGAKLSPVRASRWLDRLFHPVEPSMPAGPLDSVEVHYDSRDISLWGMEFHWLWAFFIISVAAGFALKRVFRVEV